MCRAGSSRHLSQEFHRQRPLHYLPRQQLTWVTTNKRGHLIQSEPEQQYELVLLPILPDTHRQTAGYHASEYLFSIWYPSLRATAADARLST
jgi:hypothetical protein